MKKNIFLLICVLFMAVACQSAPAPLVPTATTVPVTSALPTATLPLSTATAALSPTPTTISLPGTVVVPIEKMATTIPWLPLDTKAEPAIVFLVFNLKKPPLDNRLVRQALSSSIDQKQIAASARLVNRAVRVASSYTPPETLGRDLSDQLGLPLNPTQARALLAQAGYANPESIPEITISTNTDQFPACAQFCDKLVAMWRDNLKLNVKVQTYTDSQAYYKFVGSKDAPHIYLALSVASMNDPDNFLRDFHSRSTFAIGNGFSNPQFDSLVEQATASNDPATRQMLYIQAEKILLEDDAAVLPLYYVTIAR